jgi:hypothetical protein
MKRKTKIQITVVTKWDSKLPQPWLKIAVFWDVTACRVEEIQPRFTACCLHHPDNGGGRILWNMAVLMTDSTGSHSRRRPSLSQQSCWSNLSFKPNESFHGDHSFRKGAVAFPVLLTLTFTRVLTWLSCRNKVRLVIKEKLMRRILF